jgi:hypothetical protein
MRLNKYTENKKNFKEKLLKKLKNTKKMFNTSKNKNKINRNKSIVNYVWKNINNVKNISNKLKKEIGKDKNY